MTSAEGLAVKAHSESDVLLMVDLFSDREFSEAVCSAKAVSRQRDVTVQEAAALRRWIGGLT